MALPLNMFSIILLPDPAPQTPKHYCPHCPATSCVTCGGRQVLIPESRAVKVDSMDAMEAGSHSGTVRVDPRPPPPLELPCRCVPQGAGRDPSTRKDRGCSCKRPDRHHHLSNPPHSVRVPHTSSLSGLACDGVFSIFHLTIRVSPGPALRIFPHLSVHRPSSASFTPGLLMT